VDEKSRFAGGAKDGKKLETIERAPQKKNKKKNKERPSVKTD
jgi:hypothetical protein